VGVGGARSTVEAGQCRWREGALVFGVLRKKVRRGALVLDLKLRVLPDPSEAALQSGQETRDARSPGRRSRVS